MQDLLSVGSKIFHQTHWLPLLQMQGSVAEVQLEFLHPSGQVMPALVNAVVRGERHDLAVFVAADRRKYERELLEARRRAEALLESERAAQTSMAEMLSERAVLAEQLVGIVSHDLRTPLSVVSMGAQMLAASEPKADQDRILTRMISATKRATRLIGDLLDFTQSRLGGGLRVTRGPADIHLVVAEAIEELQVAWSDRLIEHHRSGPGATQLDADRMAQVVINLVTNALTYGAPDRVLTVLTEVRDDSVTITVHNWGVPIPPVLVPHIFEPLRRGENQVKLGSRSVGLGLYIVSQIAMAHGGSVAVESSADKGTSFVVTVPL